MSYLITITSFQFQFPTSPLLSHCLTHVSSRGFFATFHAILFFFIGPSLSQLVNRLRLVSGMMKGSRHHTHTSLDCNRRIHIFFLTPGFMFLSGKGSFFNRLNVFFLSNSILKKLVIRMATVMIVSLRSMLLLCRRNVTKRSFYSTLFRFV